MKSRIRKNFYYLLVAVLITVLSFSISVLLKDNTLKSFNTPNTANAATPYEAKLSYSYSEVDGGSYTVTGIDKSDVGNNTANAATPHEAKLKYSYSEVDGGSYTVTGIDENDDGNKSNSTNLKIVIPATYGDGVNNGKKVVAIGENAFSSIYNPDFTFTALDLSGATNLVTIGEHAFYNCRFFTGSLTIPNSVESIGEAAFYNCRFFTGTLTLPNNANFTTVSSTAFYYCDGFTGDLKIPDSVTTIGEYAFAACSGFTGNLTMPNSVTTIGSSAFEGCSGFTGSLKIPDSVESIGTSAFIACSGFMGNLTIPNSVTTIGELAFNGCSNLGTVYLPDNPEVNYGNNVFNGVTCPIVAANKEQYSSNKIIVDNSMLTYELAVTFNVNIQGEPIQTVTETKLFGFSLKYTKDDSSLIWAENDSYKFPEPTNNDFFTFSGYYTAQSGGDPVEPTRVINSDPCAFYAVYTAKIVSSIQVESNPDKTSYKTFESFDKSGMKVKVLFTDGTSAIVTDFTVTGGESLHVGTTFVTVVYNRNGQDYTTDFNITVSKADYDLSGIIFNDLTVKEDGKVHTLVISGELPNGVSVSYSGTNGYSSSGVSTAGVYLVTATFSVTDTVNYNVPSPITKTLTVNMLQLVPDNSGDEGGEGDSPVIIETDEGFDPAITLVTEDVTDKETGIAAPSTDTKVKQVYEVAMFKGEQRIQPDGNIKVKLLLSDGLVNEDNLKVYLVNEDGTLDLIASTREGNYIVFDIGTLDKFAIVGDAPKDSVVTPVGMSDGAKAALIVFLIVLLLIAVYVVSYFTLYRKGILKGKRWDTLYYPVNKILKYKPVAATASTATIDSETTGTTTAQHSEQAETETQHNAEAVEPKSETTEPQAESTDKTVSETASEESNEENNAETANESAKKTTANNKA